MEAIQKNKLGQYFTPPHIARLMVGMLSSPKDSPVLEPSSGTGVFLDALFDAGYRDVIGIEIDQDLANHEHFEVQNTSFVSWRPKRRFAAIIGNPPYIRWKNLGDEQRSEISTNPHWGTLFNSLSDYLNVFIVNAVDALESDGELVFITPSFWMHTQHAEGVRNYLTCNGAITHLVSFGESQVFDGVSSSIIIFRFVKSESRPEEISHFRYVGPRRVGNEIDKLELETFQVQDIPQFQPSKHWTIASSEDQIELQRLQQWCTSNTTTLPGVDPDTYETLGDYCTIANGMVSGLDKAFRVSDELFDQLTELEKTSLIKVVKGSDLTQLVTFQWSRYIDIPSGLSEDQARDMYPNLIRHLENFRIELSKRYNYGRNLPFWEWAFRRSESFLCNDVKKIFVPCKERITNKSLVRFSLVPVGSIATQDVTAFAPRPGVNLEVEYICAYLSLEEVTRWIRMRGLIKGGVAEFSERPLASIPFRSIDTGNSFDISNYREIVQLMKSCGSPGDIERIRDSVRDVFVRMGLPEWHN